MPATVVPHGNVVLGVGFGLTCCLSSLFCLPGSQNESLKYQYTIATSDYLDLPNQTNRLRIQSLLNNLRVIFQSYSGNSCYGVKTLESGRSFDLDLAPYALA